MPESDTCNGAIVRADRTLREAKTTQIATLLGNAVRALCATAATLASATRFISGAAVVAV